MVGQGGGGGGEREREREMCVCECDEAHRSFERDLRRLRAYKLLQPKP
jgi:hypothetical protein